MPRADPRASLLGTPPFFATLPCAALPMKSAAREKALRVAMHALRPSGGATCTSRF